MTEIGQQLSVKILKRRFMALKARTVFQQTKRLIVGSLLAIDSGEIVISLGKHRVVSERLLKLHDRLIQHPQMGERLAGLKTTLRVLSPAAHTLYGHLFR